MSRKKTCCLWGTNTSLEKLKKNPKKLVLASVFDALFFVAYGFLTAPIFRKLVEYAVLIGTGISQNAASITRGENPTLGSLIANDPQLTQYFQKLLLVYLLAAVVVYIVYVFFHSITWKISSDIAGRKAGMYEYMKDFAILNLFWVALFIVYHLASLYVDLNEAAVRSMQAQPGAVPRIIIAVLFFAGFYFAAVSYTFAGARKGKIKKCFAVGIRKFKQILPA
ncbi:hypothetical protein JW707_01200, partial [Candidatus Woesearchaeota archaeon]|nr:hypothetical protein [Candidatus Woesearchaeota archaeon]